MLQYTRETTHKFMSGMSGLMCSIRRDITDVAANEQPFFVKLVGELSDSLHNLQWLFEPQSSLDKQLHSIDYHIGAITIDLKSLVGYQDATTIPISSYEHCLKTLGQSLEAMKNEVLSELGEKPLEPNSLFMIEDKPLSPEQLANYRYSQ